MGFLAIGSVFRLPNKENDNRRMIPRFFSDVGGSDWFATLLSGINACMFSELELSLLALALVLTFVVLVVLCMESILTAAPAAIESARVSSTTIPLRRIS